MMRKQLAMLVALLLVVAVAAPAFAAVEFKYGGQFRVRWISNDNTLDGTDEFNDNQNFVDQRARLYFSFIGSENLKFVTKLEMGDTIWGKGTGTGNINRNGPGSGGNVGADATSVELKNAYVEFNIPNTTSTAIVGIQGINLMDSWVIDDDFAAAVIKTKLDPVMVTLGYVAGNNSLTANKVVDNNGNVIDEDRRDATTVWFDNVDSWFLDIGYQSGPLKADLLGYYQNAHSTTASVVPASTPVSVSNASDDFLRNFGRLNIAEGGIDSNDLFDLGVSASYKLSWMNAYLTFVKNLGSVKLTEEGADATGLEDHRDIDYEGWMVDGGANFFCGPYTFNLGGFYTSGEDIKKDFFNDDNDDHGFTRDGFVYPLATAKYFSEIIGGGILDNNIAVGHRDEHGRFDAQWTGYQMPSNIWTITAGAAWQVLEKTKLSASYWYFGASEDVVSREEEDGTFKFANDIGHELDFYITQGIVDGLTLDLVGAYLFTGDAFSATESGDDHHKKDDAYEVGARLQWSF